MSDNESHQQRRVLTRTEVFLHRAVGFGAIEDRGRDLSVLAEA